VPLRFFLPCHVVRQLVRRDCTNNNQSAALTAALYVQQLWSAELFARSTMQTCNCSLR
jgi:hypothetical protein